MGSWRQCGPEPAHTRFGARGLAGQAFRLIDSTGHHPSIHVTFITWVAFVAAVVVLLFVLHRDAREISMRDAAWSTAGFVMISVLFGIGLALFVGRGVAGQFFAGYLLEKSLSLDNVFVWALIFSAFSVPAAYQHRVLFYGVFAALVLRGAFMDGCDLESG